MKNCLIVGAGGFLGAAARYLITLLPVPEHTAFPVKTLGINLLGCFVIGLVSAAAERHGLAPQLTLFLRVGLCGGFTTFSSFALETLGLAGRGSTASALLYVLLSVVLGVCFVWLGERIPLR